jgi:hypothetical protein
MRRDLKSTANRMETENRELRIKMSGYCGKRRNLELFRFLEMTFIRGPAGVKESDFRPDRRQY